MDLIARNRLEIECIVASFDGESQPITWRGDRRPRIYEHSFSERFGSKKDGSHYQYSLPAYMRIPAMLSNPQSPTMRWSSIIQIA